jgi:hypothetical protein
MKTALASVATFSAAAISVVAGLGLLTPRPAMAQFVCVGNADGICGR